MLDVQPHLEIIGPTQSEVTILTLSGIAPTSKNNVTLTPTQQTLKIQRLLERFALKLDRYTTFVILSFIKITLALQLPLA